MTPSRIGRTTVRLAGALPSICRASSPTATILLSSVTATTDGSFRTIPRPRTYTNPLAVPRSIPICFGRSGLRPGTWSLVPAALLGNAQSQERFLQTGGCLSFELRAAILGQSRFGTLTCLLSSIAIDLFRPFRHVGENHDLVRAHLEEPSRDRQMLVLASSA